MVCETAALEHDDLGGLGGMAVGSLALGRAVGILELRLSPLPARPRGLRHREAPTPERSLRWQAVRPTHLPGPETWRARISETLPRPDSSVVERGPEKAGVGGSIPSLATTF